MANMFKYRVHEVAKDFDVNSKEVMEAVGKVYPGTKNHMTALTEQELDVIFNSFTLAHQVGDLNAYVAEAAAEREKAMEAERAAKKAAQEKAAAEAAAAAEAERERIRAEATARAQAEREAKEKAAAAERAERERAAAAKAREIADRAARAQAGRAPQQGGGQQGSRPRPDFGNSPAANKPAQRPGLIRPAAPRPERGDRPQQGDRAAQNRNNTEKKNKPQTAAQRIAQQQRPQTQGRTKAADREVRVVDTKAGTSVNLSKYEDRITNLVPDRVRDVGNQRQKFKKTNNRGAFRPQRETEAEKLKRLALEKARKAPVSITIPDEIVVSDLATRLKKTNADVVKKLMMMGCMVTAQQTIDFDTAALVAEEFGAKYEKEVVVTIEERLFDEAEDAPEDLQPREPVVVVMGHVDHGKTSLLDAIRHAHVTATEAGGITQHIGAYKVPVNGRQITFLDTPGHAAFTEMRARGANVTDIAILVVAADDGIMPQTVEAINHAKAAEVSIIVAINKMDKPEANADRVKQELTEYGLVPEEWGGDVICVPVSAVTKQGIDELLEMVLLTADMRELKANPDRAAKGSVIEAKLDKGRGPVATVLVQNGTLHSGDIIIAGTAVGRVRAMTDDKGRKVAEAGPSTPVEIIGLDEVPQAGDLFNAVEDEKLARQLVEKRKQEEKDARSKTVGAVSLDDLFAQIQQGNLKTLNIIIKADVQGSAEAVKASLEKLTNDEVRVSVIHAGVGAISESDLMLASASGAIVIGFNVRPDAAIRDSAEDKGVEIRTYRIIYECIEEMEQAMKGMLAPKYKEVVIGQAEVRQTFRVSGVGTIAGCYVKSGKISRSAGVRVLRDSVVIAETKLDSLKRFKDDAKEVAEGYECGIGLEKYNDIKEGDIIEAFVMEEIKQ